jgi:hypothetical protein
MRPWRLDNYMQIKDIDFSKLVLEGAYCELWNCAPTIVKRGVDLSATAGADYWARYSGEKWHLRNVSTTDDAQTILELTKQVDAFIREELTGPKLPTKTSPPDGFRWQRRGELLTLECTTGNDRHVWVGFDKKWKRDCACACVMAYDELNGGPTAPETSPRKSLRERVTQSVARGLMVTPEQVELGHYIGAIVDVLDAEREGK